MSPQGPIVLVAEDEERVGETRTRLARVGLENVAGYLAGGIRAWDEAGRPLARTEQITVDELRERIAEDPTLQLVDVRRPAEWADGHIGRAVSMPLHRPRGRSPLRSSAHARSPRSAPEATARRSRRALLERLGFLRLTNVVGGMAAWTGAKYETVNAT